MKLRNIIIVVLLAVVVLTFHIVRRNSVMRGIESEVRPAEVVRLLTPSEVDSLILQAAPTLRSTRIKDIDKKAIAASLLKCPYIDKVDVGLTTGGKLTATVWQHVPVMRVFLNDDEFYLSRKGTVMPLAPAHYCHLLVGSVDPQQTDEVRSLASLWAVASFLHDNPKYGDIFDQAHVSAGGDIVLVPKLGDFSVIVGDTACLKEKFENLWAFLDQGISQTGWDIYSTVNLKYRGQVVATKREGF